MNAAAATGAHAKRRRLKQAALPLPFAVRAGRSPRLILTGFQPANGSYPTSAGNSPIATRPLAASVLTPCQG